MRDDLEDIRGLEPLEALTFSGDRSRIMVLSLGDQYYTLGLWLDAALMDRRIRDVIAGWPSRDGEDAATPDAMLAYGQSFRSLAQLAAVFLPLKEMLFDADVTFTKQKAETRMTIIDAREDEGNR